MTLTHHERDHVFIFDEVALVVQETVRTERVRVGKMLRTSHDSPDVGIDSRVSDRIKIIFEVNKLFHY